MTPDWLNESVRAFGRQLGLSTLELNARGAAGLAFENGASLRLEYVEGALMVMVGRAVAPSDEVLRELLKAAHPLSSRADMRVRTAYAARSGTALFVVRIPEGDVGVASIQTVFNELWQRAERLGRMAP